MTESKEQKLNSRECVRIVTNIEASRVALDDIEDYLGKLERIEAAKDAKIKDLQGENEELRMALKAYAVELKGTQANLRVLVQEERKKHTLMISSLLNLCEDLYDATVTGKPLENSARRMAAARLWASTEGYKSSTSEGWGSPGAYSKGGKEGLGEAARRIFASLSGPVEVEPKRGGLSGGELRTYG